MGCDARDNPSLWLYIILRRMIMSSFFVCQPICSSDHYFQTKAVSCRMDSSDIREEWAMTTPGRVRGREEQGLCVCVCVNSFPHCESWDHILMLYLLQSSTTPEESSIDAAKQVTCSTVRSTILDRLSPGQPIGLMSLPTDSNHGRLSERCIQVGQCTWLLLQRSSNSQIKWLIAPSLCKFAS